MAKSLFSPIEACALISSRTYWAMLSNGLIKNSMMRCLREKNELNHSLDVDRCHVLEDSGAEAFAPVGHGAVLESPVEQDHVAGFA